MPTITYSRLREKLKSALDSVSEDREVIIVERPKHEDVVMVARSDYESLAETAYLLRSPANAKRLLDALTRSKSDQVPFDDRAALKNAIGL